MGGAGAAIRCVLLLAEHQQFIVLTFCYTRPKPAYGRQGLGWDRQARIQFRQVQFGMDTLLGNIYY